MEDLMKIVLTAAVALVTAAGMYFLVKRKKGHGDLRDKYSSLVATIVEPTEPLTHEMTYWEHTADEYIWSENCPCDPKVEYSKFRKRVELTHYGPTWESVYNNKGAK